MLERSVQKNWLKGAHARVLILSTNFRIKVNEKLVSALILVIFIIAFFSVLYCGPYWEQQVIGAERKFDGMSCWPNLLTTWALDQYNVAIPFVLFYSLSSTTRGWLMLVITYAERRFDHWQSVKRKKKRNMIITLSRPWSVLADAKSQWLLPPFNYELLCHLNEHALKQRLFLCQK